MVEALALVETLTRCRRSLAIGARADGRLTYELFRRQWADGTSSAKVSSEIVCSAMLASRARTG
jgi:hypothetical protein